MTISLFVAFAALAVLALLAALWSGWPRWLRGLLVGGTALFWFVADDFAHKLWGWPSADTLPERFVLLATVIEEPARSNNGALYLWVNALEDGRAAAQPRAYRLPYSKEMHNTLDSSMKKAREGIRQVGSSQPRAGRGAAALLGSGNGAQDVRIGDLPVPQLPEK